MPTDGGSDPKLPLLCQECGTDPLSDVLRTVKLTGALFHVVEASFPWGVEIPHASAYSSILLPAAQHVVSYHIILKGTGWVTIPGIASTQFEAGDVLVLAHGEPYSLLSSPGQRPEFDTEATIAFFRDMVAGKLPFVTREGGGGAGGAEYVCGFLG
ncbi:MAG: cupin domain-containing protein, partial [Geminicoccales bacterium]